MTVGDFAYFEFMISKKHKYGERKGYFKGHYEITDMDSKNVELSDGDNILIVKMANISKFEKKLMKR